MLINLLCIGDVVGRPGRAAVSNALPGLVREHDIHCVICNAENVAGGSGLTPQLFDKLRRYGVDLITMGDHIYRRQEIIPVLERSDRIVRPANFPQTAPGRTYAVVETALGVKVAVVSLLGRLFMKPPTDCPYLAIDRVLKQIPPEAKIVVVDMHAEATSEKIAMGWHLDGRVSVLFGTHTHVQTADEVVLPRGTAYISDVGMTGPWQSVIGMRTETIVQRFLDQLPSRFEVARGPRQFNAVLVDVDESSGRARDIRRVFHREEDGPGDSEG